VNYVFSLSEKDIPAIIEYYQDYLVPATQEHIMYIFQSPDFTVTLFRSKKVMIQGKTAIEEYLMWSEILGFVPEINEKESKIEVRHNSDPVFLKEDTIGSDEVGTGDFYGPVVVCAAYVRASDYNYLENLGVRDSKKLTDEMIKNIGEELVKKISYSVLVVNNVKYNELTDKGFNMNKIKAYLHNHAIRKMVAKLKGDFKRVVIDEFCSKENYFAYLKDEISYQDITFVQKAEDKYQSVAVASIIARFTFLDEMNKLNEKAGLVLPFGASQSVDLIGKRIALEKGFSIFREISKINFKNMQKIKEMMQ